MADARPSSAPLFATDPRDLTAYDTEPGGARLVPALPGSNQFLGHQANHHDGQSTVSPNEGNRIPRRSLPLARQATIGPPDAVNPLGRCFGNSLEGDGGDGGGGDE